MDTATLRDSPIGQLVPIRGLDGKGERWEHFAYLASPLPRSVELRPATWTVVARAEAALARLDQVARQVPEPALLRPGSLRREAQSTSALEGTYAPFEDVLESDLDERARLPSEVHEILNYIVAAEQAFAWIGERPLTIGVLASLQRLLVQGTPSEHEDAGRIRERHVFIGAKDSPIQAARFVPAPADDRLHAGLEGWASWIEEPHEDMPAVVQAALAHYQFEALHPFSDGNGRLGRLVIVLQLMRLGILRDPLLVVSPWFEARRGEYQDALLSLSRTGAWDEWVLFFATGVGASAVRTHERVEALLGWREQALRHVRAAGVSGLAERLVFELIGTPILRAAQVATLHHVTHQGAMNALRRLAELSIVEERNRNGRISFTATRVIELLNR
jgi:Fic family protein